MRRASAVFFSALSLVAAASPVAAPVPTIHELRIGPIAETKAGMDVVFAGPAAPCGERLKGRFSVFGSRAIPVDGPVTRRPDGGCSVRLEIPFSALGPEALANASLTVVGWSFVGEVSIQGTPHPVNWAGSVPREAVRLTESMKTTLTRFVRVRDMSIGNVRFGTSTMTVDVEILQPLSFDLRLVRASYEVGVGGAAVASGVRENLLLHAGRKNTLQLPVTLDHGGLLRAVGSAAWSGQLEGVLSGRAKLRVPSGELEFPFEFPVALSP